MSIRPIDMQISIAAMNANNTAHQQVNQAGVNAHNQVANIKKDQLQNKETVKDPKDSRKIKSVKENDDDKQKQKKQNQKNDKEKDDEELTEEEKKEKELKEKRKKNFVYRLGYNGKLELRPEDTEGENEGSGHIDLKA
ncbi:MAG: hypothetical protein MJ245_04560 [Clostridia bacterium]|nr:hypothetical protein [Clostridia bacterium]